MPAPEELVGYIKAMVSAAQEAGVLDDKGRLKRRQPKRPKGADIDESDEMPLP
jgi:hypothetical protein